MRDVQIRKGKAAAVEARVKTGKCLHCDEQAQTRGLCSKHYLQFHRKLAEIKGNAKAKETAKAKAIQEGLILPPRYAQRFVEPGPFDTLGTSN